MSLRTLHDRQIAVILTDPSIFMPPEALTRSLTHPSMTASLATAAYPDRVAVRADRSNRRASFKLASGASVRLPFEEDPLAQVGAAAPDTSLDPSQPASPVFDVAALRCALFFRPQSSWQ
jgi:hypothetical protein